MLEPVDPGLLVTASPHGVVAEEGRERAELSPAGQQVGAGIAKEAADVVSHERVARDTEPEQHGHGHPVVAPQARVVPGPGGGIALRSRVGGPREHERTEVGAQPEQTLVFFICIKHI